MDIDCTACGATNPHGANFCSDCGVSLTSRKACHVCGAELEQDATFCHHCGGRQVSDEVPAGPGYVVDGAWHKAPDEFVRRVRLSEMRSAYQRLVPGLDLDSFFKGTLVGQILDKLQAKSIRVPPGAVGVVVLDGKVRQVLPPGEQTTVGWLKELARLAECDLAGAGAAVLDRLTESDRMSFYLLDRRPVPMAFNIDVPGEAGLVNVQVQSLATVGGSEEAIAASLDTVVRDADSLATQDLYLQFRGQIERLASDLVHAHAPDWGKAERTLNNTLRDRFGDRNGLRFELLIAPRDTLFRLECTLGLSATPKGRACGECSVQVPYGLKFCTGCGARQDAWAEIVDTGALVTSDNQTIEMQVILAVQGRGELDDSSPVERALAGAVARRVRERTLDDLSGTLEVLGEELSDEVNDALKALGWRLVGLQVLDLRSRDGEWERGARADMEHARREASLGREWLEVEEQALQTETLTLAHVLRREQMHLNQAFARRQAALQDAQRHAGLEDGERVLERDRATATHEDGMTAEERRAELEKARRDAESDRRRQDADDASYADKKRREARLEELERMAALDAKMAEQEHEHLKDLTDGRDAAEIIAVQAGKLAETEGGAEFAKALAAMGDAQASAETIEAYKDAAKMAQSMAEKSMEAHAKVAAAKAGATARPSCSSCGAELRRGADFCGECGERT